HNLKHAILTNGPFPIAPAIDVIQQSTAGVAAAAERDIVHRDIKPQNLLLSVENVVKLTDFGLARSHESRDITVTGFFVGTPFYVAPEQVENSRRADTRADLYSLACVFFEVLTGRVPYDGEHAWDVVMQHIKAPIPSARALRPDLASAYDAFFMRALAKRAEDRYQTPHLFAEALAALPAPDRASVSVPGAERALGMLVVVASGQTFTITAPDMIIGRSDPQRGFHPDLDLLALDPAQTVSRRHVHITQREGQFFVEDLNAFNRTRVNGTPLVPHQDAELHPGDTIRLGNIELRFEVRSR
ncbi:MAG: protein kinase, partial [Ktedonobacterales bacterium]|nr:protein kinase [Ktedonobacterales bacterium]